MTHAVLRFSVTSAPVCVTDLVKGYDALTVRWFYIRYKVPEPRARRASRATRVARRARRAPHLHTSTCHSPHTSHATQ